MTTVVGETNQIVSDVAEATNAVPMHISSLVNWNITDHNGRLTMDYQERKHVIQYINDVFGKLGLKPDAVSLTTDYPCKGFLLVVPQIYSGGRKVQCDEGYLELNLKQGTFKIMHGNYKDWADKVVARERAAEEELSRLNASH